MSNRATGPASRRAGRQKQTGAGGQSGGGPEGLRRDLRRKARRIESDDLGPAVPVVEAVIDAAAGQGQSRKSVETYLASGAAAFRAGAFDHEAQAERADGPLAGAACRSGCAFCCVLSGRDGGLISAYEATQLHAALTPLAGLPDGRRWHARACPALDPETLKCRAYDVRPLICRAYFSSDVEACKAALNGEDRDGTAVLAAYPRYLAILALVRLLVGIAKVPTYSLARVAAAAVNGQPLDRALETSRHAPPVLRGERERTRALATPDTGAPRTGQ